jgi:hypothetical protein
MTKSTFNRLELVNSHSHKAQALQSLQLARLLLLQKQELDIQLVL